MIDWIAEIEKYDKKGDKTGWTYISVLSDKAVKLQSDSKNSFYVKGHIDTVVINRTALLPIGDGNYILPLNASLRKKLKKRRGDEVLVKIEIDHSEYKLNKDLMCCLADDKIGLNYFKSLPLSHQNYFSKYVDAAKTISTKEKRILKIVIAMQHKQSYSEMIRADKGHV